MTFLGAVMTVTSPLKRVAPNCCQQDNIIFGEPILAYGVMLLAASYLLWWTSLRWSLEHAGAGGTSRADGIADKEFLGRLVVALQPLSWFVFASGLALVVLAFAGVRFKLYAAPPTEPIQA
jgi:hypothetical protein